MHPYICALKGLGLDMASVHQKTCILVTRLHCLVSLQPNGHVPYLQGETGVPAENPHKTPKENMQNNKTLSLRSNPESYLSEATMLTIAATTHSTLVLVVSVKGSKLRYINSPIYLC